MSGVFKPVNPVLDLSNSITANLVFDSQIDEGSGTTTSDLVNGTSGTIAASGATWEKNIYGYDLDFSVAASAVNYTVPAGVQTLAPISIEALYYSRGLGVNGLGRLVDKGTATSRFGIWHADATHIRFQAVWGNPTNGFWDVVDAANTWNHYVCTYAFSATTDVPTIYLNGTSRTLSPTQTPTGSPAADNSTLTIGNRSDGIRNFDGKIVYVRMWNRILTSTEVSLLYANPWRIYVQQGFVNVSRFIEVGNGMGRNEAAT